MRISSCIYNVNPFILPSCCTSLPLCESISGPSAFYCTTLPNSLGSIDGCLRQLSPIKTERLCRKKCRIKNRRTSKSGKRRKGTCRKSRIKQDLDCYEEYGDRCIPVLATSPSFLPTCTYSLPCAGCTSCCSAYPSCICSCPESFWF